MSAEWPAEPVCGCGYENFERVIVERIANRPIITDFLACVGCRAMFFAPLGKSKPPAPRSQAEPPRQPSPKPAPQQKEYAFPTRQRDYPAGWIDPATTKLERLKADAEEGPRHIANRGDPGGLDPAAGGSIAHALRRRLRTHGGRFSGGRSRLRTCWLARQVCDDAW